MTYQIVRIIMLTISAIFFIRIFRVYVLMFIEFMFNQESKWYDKRVEKPKLLFQLITFIFFVLSFVPLKECRGVISFENWGGFLLLISLTIFSLGAIVSFFSWSEHFKDKYIPKVEEAIKNKYELRLKNNIDIDDYCKQSIERKYINEESLSDFRLLLQEKKTNNPIKWVCEAKKSKQITYIPLFGLLHEIVEGGFIPKEKDRSVYLNFLTNNFVIEGVKFESNVKSRYCEWIAAINKSE